MISNSHFIFSSLLLPPLLPITLTLSFFHHTHPSPPYPTNFHPSPLTPTPHHPSPPLPSPPPHQVARCSSSSSAVALTAGSLAAAAAAGDSAPLRGSGASA